ncbi:conserved exported protein of unknown function [Modestobacter italicus]|uniref:Uncharacterized protein n=1 Tax=Modestobacter italicus (strain DSM 44449 / CECT 9708 / BC 501) TaxID=2732864 RepID=I4F0H4_MODI5|nr:conserved exported protein of unknown function [Modestobacter marinus]
MRRRRANRIPADARWSLPRLVALLVAAAGTVLLLIAGLVIAVTHALHPSEGRAASRPTTDPAVTTAAPDPVGTTSAREAEELLAARPMPAVPLSASRPGHVSERDPGPPIVLPPATEVGPAGVPTGFPHTPEGAMAQLAAIDQTAMQSGSMNGARAVISAWAVPGGPSTTSWSGVQAMRTVLSAAGLSGGGSPELAIVFTPLMGQIKGVVGPDFVVPCVDFELDLTLNQTARGGIADCQRMVWRTDRWLIGAGAEPAVPPSVWPGTDLAIEVGYRDLRHG